MKTRLALAVAAVLLVTTAASQAGWGRGCGYYGGPRVSIGVGIGSGYCGPRWGWGPYWGGPRVVAVPVYRPVVYTQTVRVVPSPAGTLVRAQARLAELGYYTGEIDGAFGPLTSRAIREYQADYGLPITGRLDRATLKSLGN